MENKKDIGKAISDKLNSLDITPREQVWNGIAYELQKEKKRRIGFFFFWSKTLGLLIIGALACFYIYNQNAGVTLGSPNNVKETINVNGRNGKTITPGSNFENSKFKSNETNLNSDASIDCNTTSKNKINNTNTIGGKNAAYKANSANSKTENTSLKATRKSNSNNISSKSRKNKTCLPAKTKRKKTKAKISLAEINTTKNNAELIDLSSLQNKNSGNLPLEGKAKKTDSIIKKEKGKTITINMYPKDSIKKDSSKIYKKFYVDFLASPTIYGSFSKGSTLDRRLDSLSKKSEIKFSFGVGLTYDLSEKLSVRIGYRKINVSYVTKNVPVNANNYSGITYNPNVSNQFIFTASNGSEKMDITQKLSYTEIPLQVKYKFLDKKIGLKSSFGFVIYWSMQIR